MIERPLFTYVLGYSRTPKPPYVTYRHICDVVNAICVSRRSTNEVYFIEFYKIQNMDSNENKLKMIIEQHPEWVIVKSEEDGKLYRVRIRKLTPKECMRLMDVKDEDTDKMLSAVSKSQVYKQAGNSIVVNCMVNIFENLFFKDFEKPKTKTTKKLF